MRQNDQDGSDAEMTEPLRDNAIKCMDTLHKLLGAWFVLIVASAYLPPTAQIKLPFTDITAPGDSVRWACMLAIFLIGLIAQAIVSMLVRLSTIIGQTDELETIFTYPSVATLSSPTARGMFGICLAFVQHMVAGQALPTWHLWGGNISLAAAFAFCLPMLYFGGSLATWQQKTMENIEKAAPQSTPQQVEVIDSEG